MKIQTLGFRSHLMFAYFDGLVIDRGQYLLVRTPHNPTFYWGNFLLMDQPPTEADAPVWLEWFDQEITQQQPQSLHKAFGVDFNGDYKVPEAFRQMGFETFLHTTLLLSPEDLRAPLHLHSHAMIRPLRLPQELESAVELQIIGDTQDFEPTGYRNFRHIQMQRYAAMQAAGLGYWFGAFLGDQLLADCGLFAQKGLGRYQQVTTHPHYRKQGLCSKLIYESACFAFEHMGVKQLVIQADPADIAQRIYERVGFKPVEQICALQYRPAAETA